MALLLCPALRVCVLVEEVHNFNAGGTLATAHSHAVCNAVEIFTPLDLDTTRMTFSVMVQPTQVTFCPHMVSGSGADLWKSIWSYGSFVFRC
ncbi:hypothetical protein BDR04DRAFT_276755 [Suillus decipiens]|nr:hypothetical protein BDR04DRAFT_276755 [Suillus decipiens]